MTLYFKISLITSDECTSSGYDDVTKHHIKRVKETVEPEKENLRFYIFTLIKLGDSPMKIHQELESEYGTPCSYDTVGRWIRRFQSGKTSV